MDTDDSKVGLMIEAEAEAEAEAYVVDVDLGSGIRSEKVDLLVFGYVHAFEKQCKTKHKRTFMHISSVIIHVIMAFYPRRDEFSIHDSYKGYTIDEEQQICSGIRVETNSETGSKAYNTVFGEEIVRYGDYKKWILKVLEKEIKVSGRWHAMINVVDIAQPMLDGKQLYHGKGDASNEFFGGYGMYLYNGAIWHNGNDLYTPVDLENEYRCSNGSIIEMILDLRADTILRTTNLQIQDKSGNVDDPEEFVAFTLQYIIDGKFNLPYVITTEPRSILESCQFKLAISLSKPDRFQLLQ